MSAEFSTPQQISRLPSLMRRISIKLCVTALILAHWIVTQAASPTTPGPVLDGLGSLHHPVTTRSAEAQRYFNQGLNLLFAFNHQEAIRSFQSAALLDSDCAMAYWGVAYARGPHVNKPMDAVDNTEAWTALQQAMRLKDSVAPKERAYIHALQSRYQMDHVEDRSNLDIAFANAMRGLVKQYSDDLNAQTLFAESLMNLIPWNYWTEEQTPRPETEEVLAALRFVLSRNPDHPGANHLYIHAVEAGPHPELGLPSADRLLHYAPNAGHLVHMPSHIYMRVGQYADAEAANRLAISADESYILTCRVQGFYPAAYYPHNMHFLWWSQVFQGRRTEALKSADQISKIVMDNVCGPNQAVEAPRLRHLPIMTLVRFGEWSKILGTPQPSGTEDSLVDIAISHWAHGLAYVAIGEIDNAELELATLKQLVASEGIGKLNSPMFPITDTLAVAAGWLGGRVAEAKGDIDEMLTEFTHAISKEDELPYMEPSYWPLPVRPALAAAFLRAGSLKRAEAVFRDDLDRWPRNGWSLYGLTHALRRQEKYQQAEDVERQFNRAWTQADTAPDLGCY
jgi:tetratricopeptide (TPR) repeat protein